MHRQGKSHAPYEFGVKVSIATTLHRSKGGQFALHAMALPETLMMPHVGNRHS